MDTPCPACDGHAEPLGAWGRYVCYRCRDCGWTFQAEPELDEPCLGNFEETK